MTPVPETTVGEVPEMVMRVARALCEAEGHNPEARTLAKFTLSHPYWRRYERQARAAIAAMAEPNEAMRYAVWFDQYMTNGGPAEVADELARKKVADDVQKQQDLSSFSALIDAALGNPQVAE